MNVVERAKEGYRRNAMPIKSNRAAEYEAIAQISHRLRAAGLKRDTNFPEFVEALSENGRLWTTLAVDVAQAENALPQDLRARIFWLREFTSHETARILRGEGDLSILIEINAAVLHGLRGQADAA